MNDQAPEFEFPEKLGFLLFESAPYKIAYGGRGSGKCLAIGTRVIMADGSLRAVEDIKPGDCVMGPDSKPRNVLGVTRGFDDMYKIHQTSGIDYTVNSAHILSLKKSKSAFFEGRYPEYNEITNINVKEAYYKSKRWTDNFRGYKAGLLDFKFKEIEIDPWYLGAWLGDGKSTDTVIYSMDEEILQYCKDYAAHIDLDVSIYQQNNNKSVGINMKRKKGERYNHLVHSFKHKYNLFNNKHIPLDYKVNSEYVRLQLLAGLLDTDGYCYSNGYEITLTNETLINDVKFVADSLGFRTKIKEKNIICTNNGVTGKGYRLTINGDTWRIPCILPRKQIKKENVNKNKDHLLSQIRIEPIGKGEYAGFSLDGDHLFLLEDGTVTHNTENGARALILLARTKRMRILCGRELQNSIADSSKFTLEANIEDLGLQDEFEITKTEIVHKETGSRFFFMGLRYNIGKVKSLGRIDIVWIDEADKLSKTTIDKLLPTIRGRSNYEDDKGGPFGNGPELWIFFNPDLDDDEIYIRSVKKKNEYFPDYVFSDDNGEVLLDETGKLAQTCDDSRYKKTRYAVVQKVNYWDNKWFPPNLRTLMNVTKAQSETKYLEVWEGHTKLVLEGAIYAEELKEVLKSGRRGKVIYDPSRPVYTFWDLGHSDKTAIWFVQRVGLNYNIINFYQNNLKKIGHYLQYMQSLGYIYGTVYMPHDADNETLASRSIAKLTRDAGYKVIVVQRPARKLLGINAARTILPLCCFDEENTSEGWQCLSNYAFKVDEEKGTFSREPDHDTPWSHGADAFQTLALSLKTDQDAKKPPKSTDRGNNKILNLSRPTSWMGV